MIMMNYIYNSRVEDIIFKCLFNMNDDTMLLAGCSMFKFHFILNFTSKLTQKLRVKALHVNGDSWKLIALVWFGLVFGDHYYNYLPYELTLTQFENCCRLAALEAIE